MTSLIALALSCHMKQMMPDYYSAVLRGPNARGNYSLVLTTKFYGAEFNYNYKLQVEPHRWVGYDQRKDLISLENLQKVDDKNYSFELNSEREGRISMVCTSQQ